MSLGKEAPRLVYTSDKDSKEFLNNVTQPLVEKSEVVSSIHSDIDLMNKSRKRSTIMDSKKVTKSNRLSEDKWKSVFKVVVKLLQTEPKTKKEIWNVIRSSNILPTEMASSEKWIDNLMQLLKFASIETIYPRNGMWCIKTIGQPIDIYVNELFKNKHRRFSVPVGKDKEKKPRKSRKQETQKEEKLLQSKIELNQKSVDLVLSSKGIHIEVKIDPNSGVGGDIGVTERSVLIQLNW
jgi:hypothetical protein